MQQNTNKKVLYLVQLALLTALVVVLQTVGTFIKIGPLPLSLVLVPIVVGAFLLGPKAGAFLGAVFGFITMIAGINGTDAFSALLFEANPVCFILICLLKSTLAGLLSGLMYVGLQKLFKGKYIIFTTILASITAPIVNTGIFVLGMFLCYYNTMSGLPALFPDAFGGFNNVFALVFVGLAGLNFIGEFTVNLVLSPAIVRALTAITRSSRS